MGTLCAVCHESTTNGGTGSRVLMVSLHVAYTATNIDVVVFLDTPRGGVKYP